MDACNPGGRRPWPPVALLPAFPVLGKAAELTDTPRRVAVVGGNRIPFARSNSVYSRASNQDMLTAALDGLIERFALEGERLGEVAGGAVLKHSRDRDLTRESVLSTRLAPETPAYDVQQACGTGLETTIHVANKIALGQIDAGIACGADTTSDAPIALNEGLREVLLEANRERSTLGRLKHAVKLRPGHVVPAIPRNEEPRTGLSMGEHCALMAAEWGIERTEQDALAVRSHHNLAAAYERGFNDDLVSPYLGLERDQNLRPDSTLEKLERLRPVFGGPEGTMTAGNSTPLSDGASAVLLASEKWAKERGLPILAYFVDGQTAAIDHVHKREGLLMAPAYALPRLLDRQGLALQDFDYYEIHEAFAAQVLCTLRAWEDESFCRDRLGREEPLGAIDRERLNVNGGSLAAGHPVAATAGRIVAGLAKALHERGSGRGAISICAAAGQGVVAVLESSGGAK
jgi:acetyl-CoA C-acetyltransferase